MMQSLVPALYPILKDNYALTFGQIGLITLAFQFTASMLQPVVGMYTDKKPQPYSLMVGMGFTLVGLLMMSQANTYPMILLAAALIGMGSSVFHPEASRVARMAAGGRYGLAQSLFQVGGNIGSAVGPAARRLHRRAARPAAASCGSPPPRWSPCPCCSRSAAGTRSGAPRRSRCARKAATRRRRTGADRAAACCSPSPSWWRCCSPRTSISASLGSYLHLLPDREVRRGGADGAVLPRSPSWSASCRHAARRLRSATGSAASR